MRTTLLLVSLFAIAAGYTSPGVGAPAGKGASDVVGTLQKTLEERYPQVKVLEIKPSAVEGLYEVYTQDSIVYADASGDHVIRGPLMETRTGRNLTAERQDERDSIDFASLPFDHAIKSVKGDGSRKMAVFADPHCPFCQQLEHELANVDNVTVYTFLYPLEIHPGARERAHSIWCTANPAQTWNEWMREGKAVPQLEDCLWDPVDDLHELGEKLRVDNTPTLFFASGRRVTGVIPAAKIDGYLLAAPNSIHQPERTARSLAPQNAASPLRDPGG